HISGAAATPSDDAPVAFEGEAAPDDRCRPARSRDCRDAARDRRRNTALSVILTTAAAPGDHASVLLQSEAVSGACGDCRDAARGRRRNTTLSVILTTAAAPADHAAVLLEGETVELAGGDRRHDARGRRGDAAL